MLIAPCGLENLSHASTQYSQITTDNWGQDGQTITYTYDANGSMTKKIRALTGEADPENNYIEKFEYDYNLANRLETVTHYYYEDYDGDTYDDELKAVTTYTYNDDGIRVASNYDLYVDYDPLEGDFVLEEERDTTYLVDSFNHTGYAQVLEETVDDGVDVTTTTYLIGDDVIAQTKDGATDYLLYDGHGSTRQLIQGTNTIVDSFSYDAYGMLLGGNPTITSPAATNLLYAGEYYDNDLTQYYLRARWYDSLTGRFNRIDPFAGNRQDPQSLHKYLYAHCNPINNVDPSGRFSYGEMLTVASITGLLFSAVATNIIAIKGGTVQDVIAATGKWFWIGFGIGVAAYGAAWLSHAILVALFGAGAGFGNLKYAEEYGISSYRILSNQLKNTGLEAHHIIPGRFDTLLKVGYNDMLCVAVKPALEHPEFTSEWQRAISYVRTNVTIQEIWFHAQRIYENYPALLEAARVQLLSAGGQI